MKYEDHYTIGKWQDRDRYACVHDAFDTLDLANMKDHIDLLHGDAVPPPDVEIIRRDRFGNIIKPGDPLVNVAPPVKAEAAPLSKEIPEGWNPHQSHEERGLPVPEHTKASKEAIKKAEGR